MTTKIKLTPAEKVAQIQDELSRTIMNEEDTVELRDDLEQARAELEAGSEE